MDGSFRVRRYRLHYIGIPLSARTATAPGSVTEHVFIAVIVMISQRLSLRRVISNHSKVILNQIENLCKLIFGPNEHEFYRFRTMRDICLALDKSIESRTTIPRFLQI